MMVRNGCHLNEMTAPIFSRWHTKREEKEMKEGIDNEMLVRRCTRNTIAEIVFFCQKKGVEKGQEDKISAFSMLKGTYGYHLYIHF